MSRFMRWWYHDRDGTPMFQHYRVADAGDPRGKRFGYRVPTAIRDGRVLTWNYMKPPDADRITYRLPLVLANPEARLVLTEGERDADALLRTRLALASCHHGGAGKFTTLQAQAIAGHRGPIWLITDNDAAGAYDVCQRYDTLRAVGIPARRLRVCEVRPSHAGADLRDHIEAGHRLRDLKSADLDRLREVAATASGGISEGSWGLTDEEREQARNWRPTLVRKSS